MPELPEVEGARRLAERNCVGKTIAEAIVADDDKVIFGIAPQELQRALVGRTLVAAKRRGKQMWWEFDSGPALLLHFGMTGGLIVKGVGGAHYKKRVMDDTTWPPRFCKLQLRFEDGTQTAFCDSRRFAKVQLLESPESVKPIAELGWDPLLNMPPLPDFSAALGRQRRAIKALLLDQSFSAGIGNWVADEVLYQARVHPEQPANTIPPDKVAALHSAIQHVCQFASDAEADSGQYPDDWLFHHRWGKGSGKAAKVAGHTIDHITVGGRTSAYVPALQKLDKAAAALAAQGAAKAGKKASGKRSRDANAGDESATDLALAAAEAAVAVAQEERRPGGRRGKAAAAQKAGQSAADVAEAAAAVDAAEDGVGSSAGREAAQVAGAAAAGKGRKKKAAAAVASGSVQQNGPQSILTATGSQAGGSSTKRFRKGGAGAAAASAPRANAEPAPAPAANKRKQRRSVDDTPQDEAPIHMTQRQRVTRHTRNQ